MIGAHYVVTCRRSFRSYRRCFRLWLLGLADVLVLRLQALLAGGFASLAHGAANESRKIFVEIAFGVPVHHIIVYLPLVREQLVFRQELQRISGRAVQPRVLGHFIEAHAASAVDTWLAHRGVVLGVTRRELFQHTAKPLVLVPPHGRRRADGLHGDHGHLRIFCFMSLVAAASCGGSLARLSSS